MTVVSTTGALVNVNENGLIANEHHLVAGFGATDVTRDNVGADGVGRARALNGALVNVRTDVSAALVTGMARAQVTAMTIGTVGIFVTCISSGLALVNVNAGTILVQLEAVDAIAHGGAVLDMRTGEVFFAGGINVAIISAAVTITGETVEAGAREAGLTVGTSSIDVAIMVTSGTLVNIGTDEAIAIIPVIAQAVEATNCVDARGIDVALVTISQLGNGGLALVNVGTFETGTRVTAVAGTLE